MSKQKKSALYRHIEDSQGDRPWGTMLDAGTGVNSIRWMAGLATTRWTAVTCSAAEAHQARKAVRDVQRSDDRIVLGNWADGNLLKSEGFDTIFAGYLLGAIEGFSPYLQSYLFERLRPLARRTLYITGLEPYVPTDRPDTDAARILWEIGRFRDACLLLAGDRPYREYPSQWVCDHVARAGFTIRAIRHFSISYKTAFLNAQIEIAGRGLEKIADRTVVDALRQRGEALRGHALAIIDREGGLRGCRNYVIEAEIR